MGKKITAKKTFKLGEVCKGGVLCVEVEESNAVTVIGKEWDYSAGSGKGSSQKNAKEFTRMKVNISVVGSERILSSFLNDLTTSYHTDEVLKWIKSKVKVDRVFHN